MPPDSSDDVPVIEPSAPKPRRLVGKMVPPPGVEIPDWRDPSFPPRLKKFLPKPPSPKNLIVSFCGYGVMMLASFVGLGYSLVHTKDMTFNEEIKQFEIQFTSILEGFDTALVLILLLLTWKPPKPQPVIGPRWAAWLSGGPILAIMLGVNLGYHFLLRAIVPTNPDLEVAELDLSDGWIAILLVCVQPAIIEEILFRYTILGHLRRFLNVHLAIWITAILFGFAHIGAFISIPVLILIGGFLGYARAWSRGLLLPIIMHFFHNYAILHIQEWDKVKTWIIGI